MMPAKKNDLEFLRKKQVSVWEKGYDDQVFDFCERYKTFLKESTTERRSIEQSVQIARRAGFVDFEELVKNPPETLQGTRFFLSHRGKALALFVLGSDLGKGLNIVATHVDSPRLDFKPSPLYEDKDLAMARTHYYGGVKKYQWFSVPLGIDGVVVRADGQKVNVRIGFDPDDPVFTISDLLPHLDKREGTIAKVFEGKKLNLILGSRKLSSAKKETKDPVLLNILNLFYQKYGIVEEDFFSAELEVVPVFEPRDVGLDRSMIGGYGHDDRVCSFSALMALIEATSHEKSSCVLLLDKEEIGSTGNTGARHHFWKKAVNRVREWSGESTPLEDILERSMVLSGDVSAVVNPNYPEVLDGANASQFGMGITLTKFTGRGGKGGANDAHAEILGAIRNLLNENQVAWQNGLLGEVDQGGGGTVALFFAEQGPSVLDAGVGVMGMHSLFELVSKADVFETYRAYRVFFEKFKGVL